MKQLKTVKAHRFQFIRYSDGHIIVYPPRNREPQQEYALAITPFTVDLVKDAIRRQSGLAMGAMRDKPKERSLGELLKEHGQTPQQLSYLVPILKSDGYCDTEKRGGAFYVRYRE